MYSNLGCDDFFIVGYDYTLIYFLCFKWMSIHTIENLNCENVLVSKNTLHPNKSIFLSGFKKKIHSNSKGWYKNNARIINNTIIMFIFNTHNFYLHQ